MTEQQLTNDQSTDFTRILALIQSHQDLSEDQMSVAIGNILAGKTEQSEIVSFLTAMYQKGETAAELAGAGRALRASMHRIQAVQRPIVDTCGTGGDGSKTFNISTAAALVLAATGTPVAKHGNRAITSSTGSADVLVELGINLEASPEVAERCLEELGICFCFAPFFHPSMKYVGPARRQLGHPTIFNRLGPLANPAGAECQVLGVSSSELQSKMAQALQWLGTKRSLVVRGEDGVDEISISGPTRVLEVTPSGIQEHQWTPEMFGVEPAPREALFADDPATSAARIRAILNGEAGPCRDVVVINAAAALWLVRPGASLTECGQQIAEVIDSGQAKALTEKLGEFTRQAE